MKGGRWVLHFAALVALGVAALGAFGWLVAYRVGQPVGAGANASDNPASILIDGAAKATAAASAALEESRRTDAVHALDAAMRILALGSELRPAPPGIGQAHREIQDARRALQRADPALALTRTRRARIALDQVATWETVARAERRLPPEPTWHRYEGATVIDPNGVPIGEVERLEIDGAGAARAVLMLGGYRDFLGVLDIGGRRRVAPASDLLFGRPAAIGPVLVMLPTP